MFVNSLIDYSKFMNARIVVTLRYNKLMIIVLALKWWYGPGWRWAWSRSVNQRIAWVNEAFSILALIRTWFAPFKQTYSNTAKGSIDLRVQAAVDNFVSRLIGSLLRTILIFVGLIGIMLSLVVGLISVMVWPLIPVLPVLSVVLSINGFLR